MKILSLFDGMSCGQIALERAGISHDGYYASEIDKYAIKVTQANYPDTIQLGSLENWLEWAIDWADIGLIMGGFPCQAFSVAGKGLAFDDPRGQLFFTLIDIFNFVRSFNPDVKFLFENVKIKKEHIEIINKMIGVEPMLINSALVSAQNRQRNYWFNWDCEQLEDKGILLKDIIERGGVDRSKSFCIDANYYKGGNLKQYFWKARRQLVFKDKSQTILSTIYKENAKSLVKRNKRGLLVKDMNPEFKENFVVRKLTPVECERLQTVTDGYTAHVSNTQRYKMLGNGWTVDVIAHVLAGAFP